MKTAGKCCRSLADIWVLITFAQVHNLDKDFFEYRDTKRVQTNKKERVHSYTQFTN